MIIRHTIVYTVDTPDPRLARETTTTIFRRHVLTYRGALRVLRRSIGRSVRGVVRIETAVQA